MPPVSPRLMGILGLMFLALVIGSSIRLLSLWWTRHNSPLHIAEQRLKSLAVWWALTLAFACGLVFGRLGMAVLCCTASLLALAEFHRLFERRSVDSTLFVRALGGLAIAHYAVLGLSDSLLSLWAFPLLAMLTVTVLEMLTGQIHDYLRTTAGYFWASMLIVFGLSHVVVLTRLPPAAEAPAIEPVGWCVVVILLTEVNDIAQALIGRRLGRHKMAPTFSPGKTWEGLAGGFIVTAGLALLLAPWLTSLTLARPAWLGNCIALAAGAIISVCGLLGDLNMSGLKRESGVKDSSQLLPGMGGMIDRIDSLTLTAPAFYYFSLSLA